MKSVRLLLLIPVAAVVLAGCTQQGASTTATPEAETQDEMMLQDETSLINPEGDMVQDTGAPTSTSEAVMDEEGNIVVEMGNYSFSPSTMTVKAGDTVKLKLVNKDMMHDFVIDELDVESNVLEEVGQEEVFEFTVPASAKGKSYEYYCSVGDHREKGMVGTLIVE